MRHKSFKTPLAWIVMLAIAIPAFALASGEAETSLALAPGEHPEGITFDRDGNLYFGNRLLTVEGGAVVFDSALYKVTPGGDTTQIADFAASPLPTNGILGLVTDGDGNVYAAVDGGSDRGVWKISGNGTHVQRIAGSTQMTFPNALTFDANGNLYVTDSGPVTPPEGGAIWRLERGSTTLEKWSSDAVLAPLAIDPFGFPAPGANGIAFHPPDSLFVANTEKGQLFRIPIESDGSAGTAEAVTPIFSVPALDGIATDVKGHVHAVLPGGQVFGFPPLVEIDTDTGAITRTTDAVYDSLFDVGLSLAFSTRPGEGTELFVTAGDLDSVNPLIPLHGDGPGLIRADVGVRGFHIR